MADSSDVETAIVGLIVAGLYPNGTTQPSLITNKVSVERGWPTEADVRNATSVGTQLIRVHAIAGMARDSERYFRSWQQGAVTPATLLAVLTGSQVTFGGTVTAGEIVAVMSAGSAYTRVVTANDTPATVASALAASVPGAASFGAVLTLPAAGGVPGANIVSPVSAWQEVGRQKQVFSVSVWATTPALRDGIFSALMPALAATYRLTLPDGSIATRFDMMSGGPNDIPSRADLWARDLRMSWEYPIIQTLNAPPMAVGVLVLPSVTIDVI